MSTALVTGASRGIGAACAIALAQAGFDVGIGYVNDAAGANATADAVRAVGRAATWCRVTSRILRRLRPW